MRIKLREGRTAKTDDDGIETPGNGWCYIWHWNCFAVFMALHHCSNNEPTLCISHIRNPQC